MNFQNREIKLSCETMHLKITDITSRYKLENRAIILCHTRNLCPQAERRSAWKK